MPSVLLSVPVRLAIALFSISLVAMFEAQLHVDGKNAQAPGRLVHSGPPSPRGFDISKDGRRVLRVEDRPGVLCSTAIPRPGRKPARSYMTASSYYPLTEGELGRLARRAKSIDEFLALVRRRGYGVEPLRRY